MHTCFITSEFGMTADTCMVIDIFSVLKSKKTSKKYGYRLQASYFNAYILKMDLTV